MAWFSRIMYSLFVVQVLCVFSKRINVIKYFKVMAWLNMCIAIIMFIVNEIWLKGIFTGSDQVTIISGCVVLLTLAFLYAATLYSYKNRDKDQDEENVSINNILRQVEDKCKGEKNSKTKRIVITFLRYGFVVFLLINFFIAVNRLVESWLVI